MRRYRRRTILLRDLARQRITWLFERAVESIRVGELDYARRYVELLLRISRRTKVRVPRRIKRRICKNCLVVLIPGLTARVRIRSEGKRTHIVVTCLVCGYMSRYEVKHRREAVSNGQEAEKAQGVEAAG